MKAYTYKDSSIEVLGENPEHWKTKRLFNICDFIRGNSCFGKNDLLSEGKYVALQYGKTYKVESVNEQFKFYVNDEFYKSSQTVNYGDVIFVSTSETMEDLGHSVFYNRKDIGLIGGEKILLKPYKNVLDGKYLFYASKVFGSELNKFATGIKVFRFDVYDLKTVYINLPPLKEQINIAEYLDKATARVDSVLSIKREQLHNLSLQRKSIIHEAVTGKSKLNINCETKDSGIEWLGEIPSHWKADRIKDKTLSLVGGDWGSDLDSKDEGDPVTILRVADLEGINFSSSNLTIRKIKKSSYESRKVTDKSLIIEKSGGGEKQLVGRVGDPRSIKANAICSNFMANITFDNTVDISFMSYMFSCLYNAKLQFSFIQQTTGIQNLNVNYYLTRHIPIPPLSEQKAIVDYLDTVLEKSLKLEEYIYSQIKTLQSYRKSLIHECVTGKKQVTDRVE